MIEFRKQAWGWMLCAIFVAAPMAWGGFDIVAQTGDEAPDGNGDLSLFGAPAINNQGQLSFLSQLTGTSAGATDNQAFYRADPSNLVQILRKGELFLGQPVIGFQPTIAYLDDDGFVSGVTVVQQGAGFLLHGFRGDGQTIGPHVTPGSASPSGNNSLFNLTATGYNYDGDLIYKAIYTGPNAEQGLYRKLRNGTTTTLVLQGSAAPRGGTFGNLGFGSTQNAVGDIATFGTALVGGDEIQSLLRIQSTTVEELVRQGDVANDGSTTIEDLLAPATFMGNSGNVAFVAEYSQPGVLREGVFLAGDNGIELIAPGLLPGGSVATDNMQVFGISDDDTVAIVTEFNGTIDPDSGIYVADADGPQLIAFEDTAVPRGDRYFRRFIQNSATFNGQGQMAFLAELSNSPNGLATGRGLYYYAPNTGLTTILETGDMLDGVEVTGIDFVGTPLVSPTQFPDVSLAGMNEFGQVAFAFTQSSTSTNGIATWSLDILPGDYNDNGVVDLADYTLWRDNLGAAAGTLPNDPNEGVIGIAQYDIWKANFGSFAAGALVHGMAVPEPAAATLLLLAVLGAAVRMRR